jgi:hypothetical protein
VSQERALGIVETTVLSLCSLLPQLTLSGVPVVISVPIKILIYSFLFAEVAANQARPHT